MLLDFQMILPKVITLDYKDTPVLLKIIKINDFAIFSCYYPLFMYTFLFNYTILLYFYNICYQSRTFVITYFLLSVAFLIYQSPQYLFINTR